MAKQMTIEDRKRIDFLLQLGWTPARIAEDRGRSKSTILHETINRSVPCDRGYRHSNRICALFDACPRVKGSVRERTVYDYIAGGLFDAKRGDLPEACSRRSRKKDKQTRTNAKCRAGRDYRTFLEFCRVNEVKEWTELDTVVGRVEREHREQRRVLLHGVSFDALTQDDANLVASHVASYSRGVLGNQTPYDAFVTKFGEQCKRLLDALGIVKIPPNEVTLDPVLLGEKFKRHADRVILRKAGVTPPKNTEGPK